MITIRPAAERGHADHGWLDSHHTFSFADYHDPRHMGFRALRVINEDRVAPGQGFGAHGHRDMEILSFVLSGALAHRDSLGTGSEIRPGELQRMSAGTGVTHSEFNASPDEPVHFLQIWIVPDRRGYAPGYEQRAFPEDERTNRLRLLAAPPDEAARGGALAINQDARVYGAIIDPSGNGGDAIEHAVVPGRHVWLHVARGDVRLGDRALHAGDGAAISDEPLVRIEGAPRGEILLFDLA